MKFNCGLTASEKDEVKKEWHDFFALFPRRVASGDCRWLEVIERKLTKNSCRAGYYWSAEYRAKDKLNDN